MSSLTDHEKRYFEKLFQMQGGRVLDYSDATFGAFFKRYNIDIHGQKYQTYGTSKAKKMRAFWEQEPDILVGQTLDELINAYETESILNKRQMDAPIVEKSRAIIARLQGRGSPPKLTQNVNDFLLKEFSTPNIEKLPVDAIVRPIIESRLAEASLAMDAGAYLSTIFLCGSILEAVLLGAAEKEPARFNSATAKPTTRDGKVKRFHEWNLAQLIDVACEVGLLKPDVHKFAQGLRDFRNYIHPYEQMRSGFSPDLYTTKICMQVLKAALADIAGERK